MCYYWFIMCFICCLFDVVKLPHADHPWTLAGIILPHLGLCQFGPLIMSTKSLSPGGDRFVNVTASPAVSVLIFLSVFLVSVPKQRDTPVKTRPRCFILCLQLEEDISYRFSISYLQLMDFFSLSNSIIACITQVTRSPSVSILNCC